MNFEYSEEQRAIKDSVERLCARFDDQYWLDIDNEGRFPEEFYQAMANEGWLGICTPEQYGGAGLGIMEAAIMMRTVAESGAGMTGASAIHINIFGLKPVDIYGNEEQRERMLRPKIGRASCREGVACAREDG